MIIASRSWNELMGRSWTLFSHPELFLRKITLACLRYGGHIKWPMANLTYQLEANVMALGFLCVFFSTCSMDKTVSVGTKLQN